MVKQMIWIYAGIIAFLYVPYLLITQTEPALITVGGIAAGTVTGTLIGRVIRKLIRKWRNNMEARAMEKTPEDDANHEAWKAGAAAFDSLVSAREYLVALHGLSDESGFDENTKARFKRALDLTLDAAKELKPLVDDRASDSPHYLGNT
ncbi:MAG: hypothetical protein K8T25_21865 [Planctomycetia bacterium]|nr:hypothetical protein [Planctomycetia bacterium]